jgi:hypothetical protein
MKNLRHLFMLFVVLLISHISFSQISIQPKTYPTNSFNLSELWNQVIINHGSPMDVTLDGFILWGSQEVITISSQTITLANGVNQITQNDIYVSDKQIISVYPYYDFVYSTNTLPFGEFEICLRVKDAATQVELTRFCSLTKISPSSPPVLISPADGEEIYTTLPTFSWFPPSPILPGMNIIYDLKIVEVYNGQSAEDAIQVNNPVVHETDNPSTFYAYSMANTPLKYDTYYAWQIIAKNNILVADANSSYKDIIGQSEVFVFILRHLPTANPDECYHTISEQINSTPEAVFKKLRVLFINNDNLNGNLNYELTDSANNVINLSESYKLQRGANRFVFDLENIPAIKPNGTYIFTIKGTGNKEYQLKIKYSN